MAYGVGVQARDKANARGLTDWRDMGVTPRSLGVTGARAAPRLGALLDVNRTTGPGVRPARVGASRSEWINVPAVEFYVDFETVSNLNDDFSAIPARGGQPLMFMIGCGHLEDGRWRFRCFVAEQLTEPAEAAMIEQWIDHMAEVRERLDPGSRPQVIHWSPTRTVANTFGSCHAWYPEPTRSSKGADPFPQEAEERVIWHGGTKV